MAGGLDLGFWMSLFMTLLVIAFVLVVFTGLGE